MIYGYGRVSTKGQAKDGNSLEAQERLLKEHGAEEIYMDSPPFFRHRRSCLRPGI